MDRSHIECSGLEMGAGENGEVGELGKSNLFLDNNGPEIVMVSR